MKVIDINLIRQVISEEELKYTSDNPLTDDEKISATERLISDYETGKNQISSFRQSLVNDTLLLHKNSQSKNFNNFINNLDDDIQRINKYEDDYVYLLYMLGSTKEAKVRMQISIEKLGIELRQLEEDYKKYKKDTSNRMLTEDDLSNQFGMKPTNEKCDEIDIAVREVHILKIMNAYFRRLLKEIYTGKINSQGE